MWKNSKKNPANEKDPGKIEYSEYRSSGWKGIFLPKKGKKLRTNRYMFLTCILVMCLFGGLIAYMVRFMIHDSKKMISNPFNQRTENLQKQIVRGDIWSADGECLAQTTIDEDGNEKRVYPFDEIFAHAVGYANHGKGGLESTYNYDLLTSHADIMSQIENGISSKKNPGDTLITTLDSRLQEAAYDALGDYNGAVIAIEPTTGKIRAMVSKPVYNPNDLDEIWADIMNDESSSVLLNRCTQGLYPPGSTYKVVPLWEYIQDHIYSYNDFQYECKGETIVDSVKIHCYHNNEHGQESLEDAFSNSCNTAFVTLGTELDRKRFLDLNQKLFFGSKIPGDVSISKSCFKITMKTNQSQMPQTVIGQGDTLITPIHNALIMCAIANDGVMMRPMLAEEIRSKDNHPVKHFRPSSILTLEEYQDSIPAMKQMLRKVVTDGTGRELNTVGYDVYGKTGTAENETDQSHSWFVGYAGWETPDLVVCVIAEQAGSGSKYAAPIAKKVFDAYYDYGMDSYH